MTLQSERSVLYHANNIFLWLILTKTLQAVSLAFCLLTRTSAVIWEMYFVLKLTNRTFSDGNILTDMLTVAWDEQNTKKHILDSFAEFYPAIQRTPHWPDLHHSPRLCRNQWRQPCHRYSNAALPGCQTDDSISSTGQLHHIMIRKAKTPDNKTH